MMSQYGMSRRDLLKLGGLALGGLSQREILPQKPERQMSRLWFGFGPAPELLRAKERQVIVIFLPGGATQHDTFDPKPETPAGNRGEHAHIAPATPGMQISESLPSLAKTMDNLIAPTAAAGRSPVLESGGARDAGFQQSEHDPLCWITQANPDAKPLFVPWKGAALPHPTQIYDGVTKLVGLDDDGRQWVARKLSELARREAAPPFREAT